MMGRQQSGKDVLACLQLARLPEDRMLMEEARETAAELIARYGLSPAQWPPELLAALARTSLPKLDYHHLPSVKDSGGARAASADSGRVSETRSDGTLVPNE